MSPLKCPNGNSIIQIMTAIKSLKNFASMDQSFKEWLTTCPEEYIWQMNEVTKDRGTFTFRKINEPSKLSQ